MMMKIQNFFPGSWGSNCYLLTANGHAAIIDPSADATTLIQAVKNADCDLDFILLTHGHFDHILSVDALRKLSGAPLYIHEEDAPMLTDAHKNAFYTFFRVDRTYAPADKLLHEGDLLMLGGETLRILHTPGHSPGSVCVDCNGEFLITGDTLFANNYGRYDLWGGSPVILRESLARLGTLPEDTIIYPGHGAPETLGVALTYAII